MTENLLTPINSKLSAELAEMIEWADKQVTEICGIPVVLDPKMPTTEAELRTKYERVRIINIGTKP